MKNFNPHSHIICQINSNYYKKSVKKSGVPFLKSTLYEEQKFCIRDGHY
jgi:hypothetical protein